MLQSIIGKGLIYAGKTQLASSIQFEEQRDHIHAFGQLTNPEGETFDVDEWVTKGDTLRIGGVWVVVGAKDDTVFVLRVIQGFPPGTTAADWKFYSANQKHIMFLPTQSITIDPTLEEKP